MRLFNLYFVCIFFIACGPKHFAPIKVNAYNYGMEASRQGEQTDMKEFLKPYADSVNGSMNLVLGNLEAPLSKSWPECSLGSFMADAYLAQANIKFGKKVDIAAMNYGGIRLNSMEPGPITKRKIYELMPFDNILVLLELNGSQLQAFLDHTATRGGWPLAGVIYTIDNKKATDIIIGGEPFDPSKKYILATSDYVASGGDESNVLKAIDQLNIGYLQRDAIIDYVQIKKNISMPEGQRIIKKGE
jgi:2',3'-cyclic-nucleotide 2'-phosphodiesterase (5'-nucleotidase family)